MKTWQMIRVASVFLLVVLALAACGFIEDLLPLPKPPEPVDPLPVGSCAELGLEPVTPFTTSLGSWDLGFDGARMEASSVLLPVPAGAPGNTTTFDPGPDTWANRYPPVRNYFGIDCEGVPGVVW